MMRRFFMQTLLLMTTVALQAQVFLFDEVNYAPTATTFKLFAPRQAKKVVVRIYQDGMGSKALKTVRMTPAETGDLWTATVKGDLMGKFYTFDMGKGECPGVFAKAVGVNGQRGAIVNEIQAPAVNPNNAQGIEAAPIEEAAPAEAAPAEAAPAEAAPAAPAEPAN